MDNIPLPEALPITQPPRAARWVLALAMLGTYAGLQLAVAAATLFFLLTTGQITIETDLLDSPTAIWGGLIGGILAAVTAVLVALVWPLLWRLLPNAKTIHYDEWLAWRKPTRIALWMVPLLTVPLMIGVSLLSVLLLGPVEVEYQMMLFSSPALQVVSLVTVSTVVPVAEELIFRGALYNALLARRHTDMPAWQRHLLPIAVTSLLFAATHLIAGFETTAAIIQITLLSLYLTLLRTLTGSVQASIMGHLTWNFISALALVMINLPT